VQAVKKRPAKQPAPRSEPAMRVQAFTVHGRDGRALDEAIEKVDRLLRDSGLREETRKEAIELLRGHRREAGGQAGIVMQADSEDAVAFSAMTSGEPGHQTGIVVQSSGDHPYQVYTFSPPPPFRGAFLPGSLTAERKEQLLQAIDRALDDERLDSELAARLFDKLRQAVEEWERQPWAKGSRYRIGVALSIDEKTQAIVATSVFHDSPAATAGIQPGDRLLAIDGQPVPSVEEVSELIQQAGKAGKAVELKVASGEGEAEAIRSVKVKPELSGAVDFPMPGMNMLPPPQAWLMKPGDWQSMRQQFPFRGSAEEMAAMAEQAAQAMRRSAEKGRPAGRGKRAAEEPGEDIAAAKRDGDQGEGKASAEKLPQPPGDEEEGDDEHDDDEILEELEELEEELEVIRGMLEKLLQRSE
jgi:hypothetical protein